MVQLGTLVDRVPDLSFHPLAFRGGFTELAVFFIILAGLATILGARGVAGLSMDIAKWLVIIFIVLAVLSFLLYTVFTRPGEASTAWLWNRSSGPGR